MADGEPVDLRLVPAALAVWAVAAGGVLLPEAAAWAGGVAAGLAAAVAAAVAARGRRPVPVAARAQAAPVAARAQAAPVPAAGQVLLVLGAVSVLLLALAVQVGARESGAVRDLAEDGARVRVVGVVRSTPEPWGRAASSDPDDGRSAAPVRFLLAASSVDSAGGGGPAATGAAVEVVAPASAGALAYGTQVEVLARLSPAPDRARRPVVRARTTTDPTVRAPPSALLRAAERLRAGLVGSASAVPGDAGRLLPAMAVGDTRAVGDLEQAMRDSGLAHLTAVSGAHFSLLGAVVHVLAAWARVPRRWRVLPVATVMVGFVVLVQPGASVVRAAVMGAVGLLGLLAGRPARSVPALAGAVVVLLVVDPWLARDLGFVLSVVATAGIALLAAPLAVRLAAPLARPRSAGRRPGPSTARAGRPGPVATALAVPVAAQAVCAPVVLLLSPTVPVYAVLANVAAAPAVPVATVGGLVAALLSPWWPAGAAACAQLAGAACWWIARVACTATGLPGAQLAWVGGAAGPVLLACACGAALVLVLACRRRMAP
ncbi:ComEC/Rec2 family competence protein [Cellulomonas hominis]|uniref:ComEC/Rec2 family competence protein n=1 Tax=Cellulomonas hominis TaxID=156981 RepID=UPI001B9F3ED8|nr:ComEC/Rec2 family competence protein [Cellulomonas hominis]VTR76841.1 ComE operon protein 3 [Cellulomonas hominis]